MGIDSPPMPELPPFIAGLDLAGGFYRDAVRPILEREFADLVHSAALVGQGSEVLGFDDARSRDHDWGPRCQLFLAEADCERWADAVRAALRRALPTEYRGYPVHFSSPDPRDNATRKMQAGVAGEVDSRVDVFSWELFLRTSLGARRAANPDLLDWLTFPEQQLLEVTSGEVFHDGLGTLRADRERFAYFPRDVWLHRMAAGWQRLGQEEPFVGRCAEAGDDLGSRLIAARLVRDVMRFAFLIERRYAPYSKWLGTAFRRLDCAPRLSPGLDAAVAAADFKTREDALCTAFEELARMHNALQVTAEIEPIVHGYFARPYRVLGSERFDAALRAQIGDARLRELNSLQGAVDQVVDSSSLVGSPISTGRMRAIYGD